MRTFLLLMLLASPALAENIVAVSVFNGVRYTLYEEKGECLQGAKAIVAIGEAKREACWVQKDNYVFLDMNDTVLAVPQSQFTVVMKKTFS